MKDTEPYLVQATSVEVTSRFTPMAEPVNITQVVLQGEVVEKAAEKKEYSLGALPFIMGVVFWVHGSRSDDAWFDGEQLTGEIITGIYIATVGLLCCAGCCAGAVACLSKNSEEDEYSNEEGNASKFLEKQAQPQSLFFAAAEKPEAKVKANVDVDLELGKGRQMR